MENFIVMEDQASYGMPRKDRASYCSSYGYRDSERIRANQEIRMLERHGLQRILNETHYLVWVGETAVGKFEAILS